MPSITNASVSYAPQKRDSTYEPILEPASKKSHTESTIEKRSVCPPGHFDLTLLRPLPGCLPNNTDDIYIELHCKGRNENLCCFKGHKNAAIALNLDEHRIEQMCTKKNGAPIFHSFDLSYAPSRHRSSSYYFGGHIEDYRFFSESYDERLERFRKTYETETKRWEEIKIYASAKEKPLSTLPEFQNKNNPGLEKVMVKSVKSQEHLLNNQNNYQLLCIICQDTRAKMIFEPCKHAVLCEDCFSKGFCKKFCPTCRTPLRSTTKPNKIQIVRPRVFSAFNILDDTC